jgi:hypothetical protein
MMLKKEIIKIYNNDNEIEEDCNNTFLLENEQISIDLNKIQKVYSQS